MGNSSALAASLSQPSHSLSLRIRSSLGRQDLNWLSILGVPEPAARFQNRQSQKPVGQACPLCCTCSSAGKRCCCWFRAQEKRFSAFTSHRGAQQRDPANSAVLGESLQPVVCFLVLWVPSGLHWHHQQLRRRKRCPVVLTACLRAVWEASEGRGWTFSLQAGCTLSRPLLAARGRTFHRTGLGAGAPCSGQLSWAQEGRGTCDPCQSHVLEAGLWLQSSWEKHWRSKRGFPSKLH